MPEENSPERSRSAIAETGHQVMGETVLSQYFTLFWHYKVLIIGCMAVAVAIAGITHVVLPKKYQASVLILPPATEAGGGLQAKLASLAGDFAGGFLTAKGPSEKYLDFLKSDRTLDAVIDRFGLLERYEVKHLDGARGRLSKRTEFEITAGELIRISVIDENPELAVEMAGAFVEVLAEIDHEINAGKAGRERRFLDKRVTEVEKELKISQEAWKAFQEKHRIIRVDEGLRATATVMGELEARRIAKEIELQVLETVYAKESPELQILRAEVKRLDEKLKDLARTGIHFGAEGSEEPQWLFPGVEKIPALALEQMELQRRLNLQAKLYELLVTQHELARIAEARERSSIEIVSPATPPNTPIGVGIIKKAILAVVLVGFGFLLVGFIILSDATLASRVLGHSKAA